MDAQQAYDTVKAHLLAQNAKSTSPSGSRCLYRGPDGKRCAIGRLIPDELYRPEIEDSAASMLPADILDHIGVDDPDFLDRLQGIHDFWEPEDWPTKLPKVATEFGLVP